MQLLITRNSLEVSSVFSLMTNISSDYWFIFATPLVDNKGCWIKQGFFSRCQTKQHKNVVNGLLLFLTDSLAWHPPWPKVPFNTAAVTGWHAVKNGLCLFNFQFSVQNRDQLLQLLLTTPLFKLRSDNKVG